MRIRTVVRVHTRLLLLSCRMQTWRCARSSTSCACCDSTGSSPARVCKRISSHTSVFWKGLACKGLPHWRAEIFAHSSDDFIAAIYRAPCRRSRAVAFCLLRGFAVLMGCMECGATPLRPDDGGTCAVAVVSLRTGSAAVAVHLGAFRNCG